MFVSPPLFVGLFFSTIEWVFCCCTFYWGFPVAGNAGGLQLSPQCFSCYLLKHTKSNGTERTKQLQTKQHKSREGNLCGSCLAGFWWSQTLIKSSPFQRQSYLSERLCSKNWIGFRNDANNSQSNMDACRGVSARHGTQIKMNGSK